MKQKKRQGNQPQISIVVLCILAIITFSILYIHSTFIPTPSPSFFTDKTDLKTKSVTKHHPDLPVPAKFKKLGPQEKYDKEGLFEKINGKAPLYIDNGFVGLISQRFAFLSDSSRWFEFYLYDMENSKNAFAVFSSQRRPDSNTLEPLGKFDHYQTENGLFLRLGKYYIELIGSDTSNEILEAMANISLAFLKTNNIKSSPIEELKLFPEQGLIPTSIRLYQENAFGSDVLTNTFVARYTIDGQSVTAYISSQTNSNQAELAGEGYYRFLIDSGGAPLEGAKQNIRYVDLFGTIESLIVTDNYVAGVHEADDLQHAEVISKRLLNRLQPSKQK